jgi:Restriction endonuclease
MSEPAWQRFEVAVASFCAALDPSAKVSHNVKTPDRDTGTPRQRDVWIEARLCDHFPVKALVSCKRYKRKLNQQDMDTFLGELRSSQAQVGVLYSYSGFSKNAVSKGRAAGVSCCRLYADQPPDLPELISFASYFWRSRIELQLPAPPISGLGTGNLAPIVPYPKWGDYGARRRERSLPPVPRTSVGRSPGA